MKSWIAWAWGLAGTVGLWGLDGEVDVQVIQDHVSVVQGAPGAAPQEAVSEDTLAQGTLSHRQRLLDGVTAEGTAWASLEALPSQSSLSLPEDKLAVSSKVLEGWLAWEALPGTLTVGAGKEILHPSSGFSHTPLDFVPRGGETLGAQATSAWEEGWLGAKASWFGENVSASAFYAPALSWDQATNSGLRYVTSAQSGGFAQGQIGVTLGATDLRGLAFWGSGNPRLGLGLDSSWGDALTLRAEVAGDTATAIHVDSMAGFTWTNTDQSTVMGELSQDATTDAVKTYSFGRIAGKLDHNLDADAWTKVNLRDGSGWLGSSLTYTADHWALAGYWLGSWGSPSSDAGSSPLRWQTTVEVKAFL